MKHTMSLDEWLDTLPSDLQDEVLQEEPKGIKILMGLNPSQTKATMTIDGPTQINAVAGAGKTRVMVQRVAYMLYKGIKPNRIMITTFTKKASEELLERLKPLVSKMTLQQLTIGTTHSIGFRILKKEYEESGNPMAEAFKKKNGVLFNGFHKVFGDNVKKELMMDRSIPFEVKEQIRDIPVPKFLKAIGVAKNDGMDYFDFEANSDPEDSRAQAYTAFYTKYEQTKTRERLLDGDDLIFLMWKMFKEQPDILDKYRKYYEYIMVDEAQDNNGIQYELFDMLCYPQRNLFVVGDDDQCQPVGTKVRVENGQEINIEHLDPAIHKVVSYDKRAGNVVGLRKGYDFKINSRPFNGDLIVVEADGKVSKSTPNHKWIVKWADNRNELYCVYLMEKDNNFRIGWCKLFKDDGQFHLGVRARNQKADKAWILYTTNDPQKASMAESVYAAKFGIHLIPFVEPNGATYYTQDILDTIFREVPTENRAKELLEAMGLDYNFPMYTPELAYERRGGTSIIEVHACNLNKHMLVPSHKGGKVVEWSPISVSREHYEGPVFSLDVAVHELYIADGLVTHNSMYGFRGARPDQFIGFSDRYKGTKTVSMEDNYRSHPHVLEVANSVIKHNKVRLIKSLKANKSGEGEAVTYKRYKDETAEATDVASQIKIDIEQDGVSPKDIAILFRTNAQSRAIEEQLIINGLPYVIHGGVSFYERKEVKDIVAYLQMAVNPDTDTAFKRVVNIPSRYLGKAFLEKIGRYDGSHWEAIQGNVTLKGYEINGTQDFIRTVMEIQEFMENNKPEEVVDFIIQSFYGKYLEDSGDDEEDTARFENLQTLKFAISRYSKVEDFLDYIDMMNNTAKMDIDGVQLMTIHKSKGLEFDHVRIIGFSQGTMPHFRALEASANGNTGAIEEERRLLYVAITRAILTCSITSPGSVNGNPSPMSKFTSELGLPIKIEDEESPIRDSEDEKEIQMRLDEALRRADVEVEYGRVIHEHCGKEGHLQGDE